MQRLLLLVLLVAIPAALIALGVRFLGDSRSPAQTGPAEQGLEATSTGGSPDAPADVAAVTALVTEAGEAAPAGARAAVAELPELDPETARWVSVRAALPPGTPVDEELQVFGFAAEPNPNALADDLSDPEELTVVARGESGPDGALRIAFPESMDVAWIYVRGRYGFARRPLQVELAAEETAIDVALALGSWVRGRVALPEGADPAAVAGTRVVLRRNPIRVQAAFSVSQPTAALRSTRLADDLTFELRGVLPEVGWSLQLVPDTLAGFKETIDLEPGAARDVAVALVPGGELAGRVVDAEGQGVADARVVAEQDPLFFGAGGIRVREVTTEADGTFRLTAVRPGPTKLQASATGYLEGRQTADVLASGVVEGVVIELSRGASVAGTVRWPDGLPAGGADVAVSFDTSRLGGMGGFDAMQGASGTTQADDEGVFRVTGLGAGPFTVRAQAARTSEPPAPIDAATGDANPENESEPGLTPEELGVLALLGYVGDAEDWTARTDGVAPGTEGLELVLQIPEGIAGRVIDPEERPIGAFTVRAALRPEESTIPGMSLEARTEAIEDAAGRFRIAPADRGSWTLVVDAEGWAPSDEIRVEVPQDPNAELVIALEPAAVVTGHVVNPDGQPVTGATVTLEVELRQMVQAAMGQRRIPRAETDTAGAYRLEGIRGGDIALVARSEHWAASAGVPLSVAPGELAEDVVLILRRGATITGEVFRGDGEPAAGISVIVQNALGRGQQILSTDAEGWFEAVRLAPDQYQVIAMLADMGSIEIDGESGAAEASTAMFEKMKFEMVTVADEEEVHVILGAPPAFPVAVSGAVTANGEPVGGVLVQFLAHGGSGLGSMKMATTAGDGRYSVQLDESGTYQVTVNRADFSGTSRLFCEFTERIPREESATIDLELPIASVSGRVRGADGRPLENLRVTLSAEGGVLSGSFLGGHYADITTGPDGLYEIEWVPEGTYTVAAGGAALGGVFGASGAEHGRSVRRGVEVSEGEAVRGIDFRLSQPGTLKGVVTDNSGAPVQGASIFLRTEDGTMLERFSLIATDTAGRFEYGGIEPGSYRVGVRGAGHAGAEDARVRVAAAETTEVRLTAEPGGILVVALADPGGEPLQARFLVQDADGRQVNGMVSLADIMETFQSGEGFSLTSERVGPLPPGRYRVTATALDGRSASRTISLRAGQTEKRTTLKLKE